MKDILQLVSKNGTPSEKRMCSLLTKLCARYDIAPWIFTRTVEVDETAMPHSHPVLTVNTENEHDPTMVLAELIHEQLHWFEEERAEARDRAIAETAQYYPNVPSERPDGAGDETSTRLHLLVCYLEFQALRMLLGDEAARQTVLVTSRHHYCWIYRTILSDELVIEGIVRKHGLLPEPLRAREQSGTERRTAGREPA